MFLKINSLLAICCAAGALVFTNLQASAKAIVEDKVKIEKEVFQEKKSIEKVNINSADQETLQKMKYMSKQKAKSIIEYRNKKGAFKSLDELLKVKCRGIHENWLGKASKHLTI